MRIMLFDVPAESGGAITILKQYYEKAIADKENHWIFVVSIADLESENNVQVLKYPWVKNSWLHRLFFDHFIARKIVRKHDIDAIISLQNTIIDGTTVPQTVYVHQSLPFSEIRFSIFENFKFWIYQNIIGRFIIKSIKRADKVIVQTNWMKDACVKLALVNQDKIYVEPPVIQLPEVKYYSKISADKTTFFYPAMGAKYKNHRIIVEASNNLVNRGISNFKVILTIKGNENKEIKELYQFSQRHRLPIEFIGTINQDQVFDFYSKSILIFPSYVETFGLPLLEAKMHQTPILASDCKFSHEILDDYNEKYFFNPFDVNELERMMEMEIEKRSIKKEEN